jgi:hypothetical protein
VLVKTVVTDPALMSAAALDAGAVQEEVWSEEAPAVLTSRYRARAGFAFRRLPPWLLTANAPDVERVTFAAAEKDVESRGWRHFFAEYRPDGWPLCPCCGEDELGSRLTLPLAEADFWNAATAGPVALGLPPVHGWLEQYIAAGLYCHRCPWWFFLCPRPEDYAAMGFHVCKYCKSATGSGDVLLPFASGRTYLVPDLLVHYVSVHHYLPPPHFIADVESATLLDPDARPRYAWWFTTAKAAERVGYLTGEFPVGEFPHRLHGILAGLLLQAGARGFRQQTRGG